MTYHVYSRVSAVSSTSAAQQPRRPARPETATPNPRAAIQPPLQQRSRSRNRAVAAPSFSAYLCRLSSKDRVSAASPSVTEQRWLDCRSSLLLISHPARPIEAKHTEQPSPRRRS